MDDPVYILQPFKGKPPWKFLLACLLAAMVVGGLFYHFSRGIW